MFSPKSDVRAIVARERLRAGQLLDRVRNHLRPAGEAGPIRHATFERTFVCNLRCSFCSQWKEGDGVGFKMLRGALDDARIRNELTVPAWLNIARQLRRYRTTISITGGEPFVRADSIDLIEGISELGLEETLTTNGTKCPTPVLERLAATRNLRAVNFSLDGDEEAHDRMRGRGSFARTYRAAAELARLRDERSADWPKLELRAAAVLVPSALEGYPSLASKLRAAGLDQLNIAPCRWFTKVEADRHVRALREDFGIEDHGVYSELAGAPFPEDFPERSAAVLEQLERDFPSFVYVNPVLRAAHSRQYHTDLAWSYRPRCDQMYRALRIRADGKAIFCPDQWIANYFLGDLRTQSVDEVWHGMAARRFREAFRARGSYPGCVRCCIRNRPDS